MTLIKLLLLAAIVVIGLLAFRGSRKALHKVLWRAYVVLVVLAAGLSVMFPDALTTVAQFVGVGRGADLLLYVLVVTFMLVSVGAVPHGSTSSSSATPSWPGPWRCRTWSPSARVFRQRREGAVRFGVLAFVGMLLAPGSLDPGGAAVPRDRRVRPRLPRRRGGPGQWRVIE